MMTFSELDSLPVGRVVKRFVSESGSHSRMKIVKPVKYTVCDFCNKKGLEKIVKEESGGNMYIIAMCLECAVEEINGRN